MVYPAYRVDGDESYVCSRGYGENHSLAARGVKARPCLRLRSIAITTTAVDVAGSAFGYRDKKEEEEVRKRDVIDFMEAEMIKRNWLTEADLQTIQSNAQQIVSSASSQLTDGEVGSRIIKSSLWPDINFRDKGLRGDLSEFEAVEFVESKAVLRAILKDTKFGLCNREKIWYADLKLMSVFLSWGEDVHRLRWWARMVPLKGWLSALA